MLLRELMVDHRHEILKVCRKKLHDQVTSTVDLMQDLEIFFDEIVQALRYHDGFDAGRPALPGTSEAAARLGSQPQRAGLLPAKVPLIFGALSTAIGHVGERYGLSIDADEYRIFNQCIDAGVATSIENFWRGERAVIDRQVTQKFGDLAYELRGALGNASLAFKLLRGGDLASTERTAAVLANNLVRMETLIAKTLGTVHLDTEAPLDLQPVRVASVLRQLQASAIPDRAISITLALDESVYVNADETLLTSAVSNLLHNAVRFSGAGACVTLSCRADDDGVIVEVEDECGGLAEDESTRLSSTFEDGQTWESRGLGLAMTQRAVAAMDGRLSVENRPNQGCTFKLTFPPARPTRPSVSPSADAR